MKQFLYLLIGGGIIYGWWNFANTFVSPSPMTIFIPLALPVGLICFCFALVKVNDRPFEFFVLSMIRFLVAPKQRKWVEGYNPETVITLDKATQSEAQNKPSRDVRDLDSLAKGLEEKSVEIAAKNPTAGRPTVAGQKPKEINLAVNDVQAAAEKQQGAQMNVSAKTTEPNTDAKNAAQPTPSTGRPADLPAKKGGLFGLFK